MNRIFRFIAAAIVAVVLALPVGTKAGPRSRSLNQDAAVDLLYHTLKRDRVYEDRISWDCITIGTEDTTDAYFDFVLREIHNAKCGGAPEWSPVIDRYRVYRRSRKIEWYRVIEDSWQRYSPPKSR